MVNKKTVFNNTVSVKKHKFTTTHSLHQHKSSTQQQTPCQRQSSLYNKNVQSPALHSVQVMWAKNVSRKATVYCTMGIGIPNVPWQYTVHDESTEEECLFMRMSAPPPSEVPTNINICATSRLSISLLSHSHLLFALLFSSLPHLIHLSLTFLASVPHTVQTF